MTTEIKVPILPESVSDATVSTWHKKVGDQVARNENLVDLETDKVMLEVPSTTDGIIKEILKASGSVVKPNEILAIIETNAAPAEKPSVQSDAVKIEAVQKTAMSAAGPASRRVAAEHDVDIATIQGTGKKGRITKENVIATIQNKHTPEKEFSIASSDRPEQRVAMTRIRARIAERLLEVTQATAMLTTFNEVNLQQVIELRNRYREAFEKKHKIKLGFMSFFVRAVAEALKRFPVVNASIDGNDIVYHGYYDIGVAVSTDRGLVVPVLRDADKMSMAQIETHIADYATKARAGKLTMEEMQGGTFTITNGGVFGSLMATPIVNAPQCAILGMHKIQERPIAENGQIVIRPMMYLALSYDHRLIDGRESVTFLVTIKELLEDPSRLLLEV